MGSPEMGGIDDTPFEEENMRQRMRSGLEQFGTHNSIPLAVTRWTTGCVVLGLMLVSGVAQVRAEEPCPCGREPYTILGTAPNQTFQWGHVTGESNALMWADGEVIPIHPDLEGEENGEWNPLIDFGPAIGQGRYKHFLTLCGASPDMRAQWRAVAIRTRGFNGVNVATTERPWANLVSNHGDIENDKDFCKYSVHFDGNNYHLYSPLPAGHGIRYNYVWTKHGDTSIYMALDQGSIDGEEGRVENIISSIHSPLYSGTLRAPATFFVGLRVQDFASSCFPVPGANRLGVDPEEVGAVGNPKLEVTVPIIIYPRIVLPDVPSDYFFTGTKAITYSTTPRELYTNLRLPTVPNASPGETFTVFEGDYVARYIWVPAKSAAFDNQGLNNWQQCHIGLDLVVAASVETSISHGFEITTEVAKEIGLSGSYNFSHSTTKSISVTRNVTFEGHQYIRAKVEPYHLVAIVTLTGTTVSQSGAHVTKPTLLNSWKSPRIVAILLNEFAMAVNYDHCGGATTCPDSSIHFGPN